MNKVNSYSHKTFVWCLMMIFHVMACAQNGSNDVVTPPPNTMAPFSPAEIAGDIQTSDIQESSGIVASRAHASALWTHNDSGREPKIYLISTAGEGMGTYYLKGAQNRDWEDIAIGPGPQSGVNYIYVGEIGDNNARYETKIIYRFPEPAAVPRQGKIDTLKNVEEIRFTYPDGKRDAETLMIDPITKDLYVLSKREASVHIYRAAYPQSTDQPIVLEMLGELPLVAANIGDQIVGGDISKDGKEILLKSYSKVYYWKREDLNTSIADLLKSAPIELPYEPEAQGEAITFTIDNSGYYTLSEKSFMSQQQLFFYKRK